MDKEFKDGMLKVVKVYRERISSIFSIDIDEMLKHKLMECDKILYRIQSYCSFGIHNFIGECSYTDECAYNCVSMLGFVQGILYDLRLYRVEDIDSHNLFISNYIRGFQMSDIVRS